MLQREELDELLLGEDLLIALGAPAQQGDEVDDRIGQKALRGVIAELGADIALAHLGAVGVLDEGDVGIHGRLRAEGLEELQVLKGVHDVILAADDVRDAHLDVVHHVDQMEDVGAIRALDNHVGRVLRVGVVHGDVAADEVVQGHDALALEAETPDGALAGAGDFIAVLVALVGGGALVHAPQLHQFLEIAVVNLLALALVVGGVGTALALALVPVQPQPAHACENGLHGVLHMAFLVGVLDAQHKGAAHLAGKQIVEQGGASPADVQIAGRRGGKTGADGCSHARLIHPRAAHFKRRLCPQGRAGRACFACHAGRVALVAHFSLAQRARSVICSGSYEDVAPVVPVFGAVAAARLR